MQGVYVRLVCCSRFDSSTDPAGRSNLSNVREVGADYEISLWRDKTGFSNRLKPANFSTIRSQQVECQGNTKRDTRVA